MAKNQQHAHHNHIALKVPEGTVSGQPVRVGAYTGVALIDRLPDGTATVWLDGSWTIDVAGAAKHLTDGALNAQAARIDNGSLSVDFTRSTFATQLNVSSPTLGVESVRATGVVLSSGVMQSRTGDAFVAGALSNDRKEAGYFFEKAVPSGSLTGITLWGR